MKLRTRIILMSFIAVLTAVLISDAIIWNICRDTLMREVKQTAYSESHEIFHDFDSFIQKIGTDTDETYISYFFKSRDDDYTVCVKKEKSGQKREYYNHTVFSAAALKKYEYKIFDNDVSYSEINWDGYKLLCFRFYAEPDFELYHIVDISGTYRKLAILAFVMAAILVSVTVAVGLFLRTSLRRVLKPLNKLSETAMRIAKGAYEERVEIIRDDEIGALANDFNTMAEAVERHTKELEESEQRKNLFMGNLTHELKTPLTAISGYAETMRRIKLSEADEAEALDYICKECHRLERLSKKMMRLLELDHSADITFTEFTVKKLFKAVKESCDATAKQREISIVIRNTNEVLYADFDLMCDALINLTDNAIKASKPASQVRLYTERTDEAGFFIIVEDFGDGIAQEEQAQILEPFYMVDKSRSRKNGGAGLGLALTSLILRNHEMTLDIESEIGHGTKMRIYNLIKSR